MQDAGRGFNQIIFPPKTRQRGTTHVTKTEESLALE